MINKKITSEVAVGIILIVAVVIGGIFWMQGRKETIKSNDKVAVKQLSTSQKSTSSAIAIIQDSQSSQNVHVAYTRQLSTSEEPHLIYDGKDLGLILGSYDFEVSDDHVGFFRKINNEEHLIYDGKDLGVGIAGYLELDGDNITFLKTMQDGPHVIHNGIDFGRADGVQAVEFEVSGDNVVLLRKVDGKLHVFYNQKDLGEGDMPIIGENSIAFIKRDGEKNYIIYNGKNMGEGNEIESVSDKYVFFSKYDLKQDKRFYFRNQENLGVGENGFKVVGDHYILFQKNNTIFDGKNIGNFSTSLQINKIDQLLPNGNYAYYNDINGETHVFYNQKDLGVGSDFDISENNIVFTRRIDGNDHIIFNGKDLGEGTFPAISDDNIVYSNTVKAANGNGGTIWHVFLNGKDLGECAPSQGPDFSKTLGNCQNIKFSE